MHLVTSLFGTGWLEVGEPETSETQFVIGVWRDPDGTLVGRGQIAGDAGAIGRAGMAPGPVPRLLPDGRAVDVTNADGEADAVWKWLDANGGKYGLNRPMPGNDPAHVQSRGDWKKIALALRETRLKTTAVAAKDPGAKSKVAKASW